MPSTTLTTGLIYTYNATDYSSTGNVVLGFKASMEAECCLCTEAAIAAFLSTYRAVIIGEIKVELIRCTATRRTSFAYEVEATMPTTLMAQEAARSITSPGVVATFNTHLDNNAVPTTVSLISTSNMIVSEVDNSSSITFFWIIFLTLVCTVVMLGAIGAFTWKVRTLVERDGSNGPPSGGV